MPLLDPTAEAAVAAPFARADFLFLDIAGDPLRVTTHGKDVTFTGTGDADLDGFTFVSFGGQLLDISNVGNADSGSDTRTITLSGILDMDLTLLDDIGNKALWQGRTVRTWFQLYDPNGATAQGAIVQDYTGYMSKVSVPTAPDSQKIVLSAENYLAFTTQASNRSLLNQKDYDPSDTSAGATIACSNGLSRSTGATASTGVPGSVSAARGTGATSLVRSY